MSTDIDIQMKAERTAQRVQLNLRSRHAKKQRAIELLGGKCVHCGSTENLEFDHINRDRESNEDMISQLVKRRWELVVKELSKCQLLCKPCHVEKSIKERGLSRATHGRLSMYTNGKCRCQKCRETYNSYMRSYMAKRARMQAV